MQMHQQINSNKGKTYLFLLLFCLFIGVVVFSISYNFSKESAYLFTTMALVIALLGSFFTYYNSDKILLRMANAHPVAKEKDPYLHHTIEGVAIAANIPTPKAYVIETDIPNAFATGRNPKNSAIAVTRGLLNIMNREELEGVIAHEISHIKNYDILFSSIAIVLTGTLVYLAAFFRRSLFYGGRGQRRGKRDGGNAIMMIIGMIIIIFAPLIAKLIQMALSRNREYLADATAARTLGYPIGLASALEKLAKYNNPQKTIEEGFANEATAGLFIVNPLSKNHNIDSLFMTHPPLEKRISNLRNI
ncbi:MAG: zinc metalloprotease HtpX [Firmicutes bacterium HGW-Firmicutes-12]|nr:MAG: zinc metalloprotease HtpX [Firmicutes bacterium HGW-Firmicutes-12]